MGRSEATAGLLRMGFSPTLIGAALGITTSSAVDYLYRAVGRRYISTADIVLSIPRQLRDRIDAQIASRNTADWWSLVGVLRKQETDLDVDLLRLYLHLRGALVGELYFLITEVERLLHAAIVSLLGQDFQYRYFSELAKKMEETASVFPDALSEMHDLSRAVQLRNRVMHPTPPFQPADEDFEYVRDLRDRLVQISSHSHKTKPPADGSDLFSKLEAAAKEALVQSQVWQSLDDETKRRLTTRRC